MTKDEYDFNEYVEKQVKAVEDGNHADFRPTYDAETDAVRALCLSQYQAGKAYLASLTAEELKHCKLVFEIQEGEKRPLDQLPADELCELRLDGKTMIVPRYLSALKVTEKLRRAMT